MQQVQAIKASLSRSSDLLPDGDNDEHHWTAADPQSKLLRWYHHLGHLSFETLNILTELGEIPKSLAKILPPKCAGGMFGAMANMEDQRRYQPYSESYRTWQMCLCRPTHLHPSQLSRDITPTIIIEDLPSLLITFPDFDKSISTQLWHQKRPSRQKWPLRILQQGME